MIKCIIPSNLNLRKLLERHPITGDKDTHKDAVYFICHSIIQQMQYLKGRDMIYPEKKLPYCVPLSAVHLKNCLGSRIYKPVLDWMIVAGVIESDNSWEKGRVSQGYRFRDHYLGASFRWVTLTSAIGKKIVSVKEEHHPFCPQVIGRLKKWFKPAVLTIEAKAARKEIKKMYEEEMAKALSYKNRDKRNRKMLAARIKASRNENAIESFITGEHSFTQDEFGFRFHSPLTRLNKRLRQFVLCNGEALFQLDISGSQLYFGNVLLHYESIKEKSSFLDKNLFRIMNEQHNENRMNNVHFNKGILIEQHNRNNENKIIKNNRIKNKDDYNKNNKNINNNTIMFPHIIRNILKTQYCKGLQHDAYFQKTVSGLFYEAIVHQLEVDGFFPANKTVQEKRRIIKRTFLAMLFGNWYDKRQKRLYNKRNWKVFNAFEVIYPDVADLFNELKEEADSKVLCMLLQRIESIFMLGIVCKRLQNEFPNMPIYTIHDCIVTTASNINIVRRVMEEEAKRLIGAAPKISETAWCYKENTTIPLPKVKVLTDLEKWLMTDLERWLMAV